METTTEPATMAEHIAPRLRVSLLQLVEAVITGAVIAMVIVAASILSGGCQQTPSRSQTIKGCTYNITLTLPIYPIYGAEGLLGSVITSNTPAPFSLSIDTGSQAMAVETGGSESQSASATVSPETDFNLSKGI